MANKVDVVYPNLSYKIIGSAFKVFNKLGYGLQEKHYQRAFELELKNAKLACQREKYIPLTYESSKIGSYFVDFIVDDKVVVELKVRPRFGYVHIKQVVGYLDKFRKRLGLIIYFTKDGVRYRRILNPHLQNIN